MGHVSEPRVAFDRPSLSFGQVLVGGRTHATLNLVNSEHMPFQFELEKASYDASPALLESTGLTCYVCMTRDYCVPARVTIKKRTLLVYMAERQSVYISLTS